MWDEAEEMTARFSLGQTGESKYRTFEEDPLDHADYYCLLTLSPYPTDIVDSVRRRGFRTRVFYSFSLVQSVQRPYQS